MDRDQTSEARQAGTRLVYNAKDITLGVIITRGEAGTGVWWW